MGRTHYVSFGSNRGRAIQIEKTYQMAIIKCAKVVRAYSETDGGLSGYTAHDKTGRYGGLCVNGSNRVGACEPLELREHFAENKAFFCKTNAYPYDTVVTACLIILKHYLGDSIQVGSDGFVSDWIDGLQLAQNVLGLKSLRIPASIKSKQEVA